MTRADANTINNAIVDSLKQNPGVNATMSQYDRLWLNVSEATLRLTIARELRNFVDW